ncbi:hypothetical protein LPBF_10875 [Flavobacterium crassostreae]|uniref:Uncharacterized protein n=1 Tax=Flavobacterium crassostreae TaxID=1763534 RepID=A0A1B9DXS2_9FLAO|nr:hypothetical protein LPBF_10875 [Flavobacterium crassostreae]
MGVTLRKNSGSGFTLQSFLSITLRSILKKGFTLQSLTQEPATKIKKALQLAVNKLILQHQ